MKIQTQILKILYRAQVYLSVEEITSQIELSNIKVITALGDLFRRRLIIKKIERIDVPPYRKRFFKFNDKVEPRIIEVIRREDGI